jgi:sugar lactone lactonase YvrE
MATAIAATIHPQSRSMTFHAGHPFPFRAVLVHTRPSSIPAAGRLRLAAALVLATLATGCGGGGDDTGGARSSVVIAKPLSLNAYTVAPGEPMVYSASCSGNGAVSYEWDPGDGSAVTRGNSQSFSYRYDKEGEFLPRVTCRDAYGGEAISAAAAYAHVLVPKHALTGIHVLGQVRGADSTKVTLKADCASESGAVLGHAWDFGDGTEGSGQTVSHEYANAFNAQGLPNQYTVTARCIAAHTLKDVAGRDVSANQEVSGTTTVLIDEPSRYPAISVPLRVNPSVSTTAGSTVLGMTCTPAAGGSVTYAFDFGDGTPMQVGSGNVAKHTYALDPARPVSRYTVSATCSQSGLRSQAQSMQVSVRSPKLSLLAGQTEAQLGLVRSVVTDAAGTLYLTDTYTQSIRKVTREGAVSTLAGGATHGFVDGQGAAASFQDIGDLVIAPDGSLYVIANNAIRRVSPSGRVTTVAGGRTEGYADGVGAQAAFANLRGLALDGTGNVYFSDNSSIRKMTPQGVVSTLAGGAHAGNADDGVGPAARFNVPDGIAVDRDGSVYVADTYNHAIRKISPAGAVSLVAGGAGGAGYAEGRGRAAVFNRPVDVALDGQGNLLVADAENHRIRKIDAAGEVTTLAGGVAGSKDGAGAAAQFRFVSSVALDSDGGLYVVETQQPLGGPSTLRKVTAQGGVSTPFSGWTSGFRDGAGSVATFTGPAGVAADALGNVYVADTGNHVIRKVTPAGVVSTFAGDGQPGLVDGQGTAARFSSPIGLATDAEGNVYVADSANNVIRKITPTGRVGLLAGSGVAGRVDGIDPAASRFSRPVGVAVDTAGNVYVADTGNHAVRKIGPAGAVSTLAGGSQGNADGVGAAAQFSSLQGVAVDSTGHVYAVDLGRYVVRRITPAGAVSNWAFLDGLGGRTVNDQPVGIAVDHLDNVYVANPLIKSITKITSHDAWGEGVVGGKVASTFVPGYLPGSSIGNVPGIALVGRRLVLSSTQAFDQDPNSPINPGDYVAEVDFTP